MGKQKYIHTMNIIQQWKWRTHAMNESQKHKAEQIKKLQNKSVSIYMKL